jgi:hypothetical protein
MYTILKNMADAVKYWDRRNGQILSIVAVCLVMLIIVGFAAPGRREMNQRQLEYYKERLIGLRADVSAMRADGDIDEATYGYFNEKLGRVEAEYNRAVRAWDRTDDNTFGQDEGALLHEMAARISAVDRRHAQLSEPARKLLL